MNNAMKAVLEALGDKIIAAALDLSLAQMTEKRLKEELNEKNLMICELNEQIRTMQVAESELQKNLEACMAALESRC